VSSQINNYPLPFCAENVCLEVDSGGTGLYAAGSRSHVTLLDGRASGNQSPTAIRSPDKDCGVRSLSFNDYHLTLGTGAGNLYFYDMRTNNFLLEDEISYNKCVLHSTPGWLVNGIALYHFIVSYYFLQEIHVHPGCLVPAINSGHLPSHSQ